ncbi:MAG: hypothetical protein M1840_009129 [Geoglossum simile]|nr:MAG: hypothetical protein M1840_009129 [Geoglossum simile]
MFKLTRSLVAPLLDEATNDHRSETRGDDDHVLDGEGVEELFNQARALEPKLPWGSISLGPILSHVNNFAAILAVFFGADPKVTALVWGSTRIIFSLASPKQGILSDVIDTLGEVGSSLPRFATYHQTLPVDKAFKSSLVAAYTEMTYFCARTIIIFRGRSRYPLLRRGWPQPGGDFQRIVKRLKCLSQDVDMQAQAARMRLEGERHTEVLSALKALGRSSKKEVLPCYCLPSSPNEKLIRRKDELKQVADALGPRGGDPQSRSLALYGMGGAGKTAIARQYASNSRGQYDAIFWISAVNMSCVNQDFLVVAKELGLVPGDRKDGDAVAVMSSVHLWLSETDCRWLLIFDNANDLEALACAWPRSGTGSILLTTRDFTASPRLAAAGLAVQPFDDATGGAAFLELLGQSGPSQENIDLAKQISHTLGGLPLALGQISGFVMEQNLPLKDFLPSYERDASTIHMKQMDSSDYRHTLSTVWRRSLDELTGRARTLHRLLAFFDPDRIAEEILTRNLVTAGVDDFNFLADGREFLGAKEVLLRAALIGRSKENSSLSVHRLVRATVIHGLTAQERQKYFNQAVCLLIAAFPCAWGNGVGYTFRSWDKCEMCFPHVQMIVAQAAKYKLRTDDKPLYRELLMRCSWYLYERERCHRALPLMSIVLQQISDRDLHTYARAADLLGLLQLDTNRPSEALSNFITGLHIRQVFPTTESGDLASSLNHVSLAFTELRDWGKAAEFQKKALDIRLATDSPLLGNSYSNMSSILLGMGKPDEAEEMLGRCPSLQASMNGESGPHTYNPRFSSDWVLLSKIRTQQGRPADALRLLNRAVKFYQKTYGARYKTCDALYQIATIRHQQGDSAGGISLLERCIGYLTRLPEPDAYLARAYFRLSTFYAGNDEEQETKWRNKAIGYRNKVISADGGIDPGADYSEDCFNALVPWMLW